MPNRTGHHAAPTSAHSAGRVRRLRTFAGVFVGRVGVACLFAALALPDRPATGQTIAPAGGVSVEANGAARRNPLAIAGISRVSSGVGVPVQLDGRLSDDPEGVSLNYRWIFVEVPAGSTAMLSGAATENPTFIPDRKGAYRLQLVVDNGRQTSDPDVVELTVPNTPPVAKAGADRVAVMGGTVRLDAGKSSDADDDALTYQWSFISRPAGSRRALSGAGTSTPSFLVDRPGRYAVQLVASDGEASGVDVVNIDVANTAPVADAGADQTAAPGAIITLDGSRSTDLDGDRLTYTWSFVSRPAGSAATLSGRRTVRPTFVVDVPGRYVVGLIVHDGQAESALDSVSVSTGNSAPVASAGPDTTAQIAQTVRLSGRGSSDVDGNALTFSWAIVAKPAGSTATLSGGRTLSPTFQADRRGTYEVGLVVNDGSLDSAMDTVRVAVGNTAPVASAGTDQHVERGATVVLDGRGSTDVDGDVLTYSWALTSVPDGSTAMLSDPSAITPTFEADVAGMYIAQLVVSDSTRMSVADTVSLSTGRVAPIASGGLDQTVRRGEVVLLNGSASSAADGGALTYRWSLISRPGGSVATLTGATTIGPSFTPDLPGDYIVQLVVNDGAQNSAPESVVVTTTNSVPVADAGPTQVDVPVGSTVALDGSVSFDADGQALTYRWALIARPDGSMAAIGNSGVATPEFTADVAGAYVAQLVVGDGAVDSAPDTVLIRTDATDAAGADQTADSSATAQPEPDADSGLAALPVVTVLATDASASENGPVRGTFTVTRTGPTTAALSVAFTLAGTARNGTDYTNVPLTVTIPVGAATAVVRITPTTDTLIEGNETAILTLAVNAAYTRGTPNRATVTIADGTLVNGLNYTGSISRAGETDVARFTAAAGSSIIVSIAETGANSAFVPWIRLLGPSGAIVAFGNNWGDLAAQFQVTAPTTGTYTVQIASADAGNNDTGNYRLTTVRVPGAVRVASGDQGGAVTNGGNHTGTIQVGDLDPWTFTATAGQAIIVDIGETGANSAFVPWIRLFGPTGAIVAFGNNWGDLAAQFQVTAPATGAYTLVVSTADAGNDASGTYTLTVVRPVGAPVVSAGDHGGPISNGGNHAGTIHVGDLDPWTFTATAGQSIIVDIAETGANSAFVPWIRLFGPTGVIVPFGNNWGDLAAQFQVTAPATGAYTLVVSTADAGNDASGTYTLTVVRPVGAPAVSAGDHGGPISNGGNHTGTIHVGDLDPWTFTATAGQSIIVDIGETGANSAFVPWIRLFGPTGVIVPFGNNWGDLAAQFQVTAPATGAYTLVVSTADAGNDASGTYTLTVVRPVGAPAVSAGDHGGPISNGGNHTGTIHVGDLDPWTFTATAGQSIIVDIAETGANSAFVPWIRLFGPTGVIVPFGNNWGDLAAQLQVTAPATGSYTIVVSTADAGNDASGSYTLTVVRPATALVVSPGDQGGAISNGGNHTGTIQVGDLDPWTFTATAGETIIVNIGETGANSAFVPWIRLFGPTGVIVPFGNNWGDLAAQFQVTAPATGTYTVVVSTADAGNDASGAYVLTVLRPAGALTVPAGDQGGALTRGVNHAGTIQIGDLDPWTVTASAGRVIQVSITESGPNTAFVPWIRVFGPTGGIVAFGNNWGDLGAAVKVTAPTTGRYTVVVSTADTGNDATGSYVLTVS